MSEVSITIRLSKAAKEFNVGSSTILEFLARKGFKVENNPNAKLTPDMYGLLLKEYQPDKVVKEDARKIEIEFTRHQTLSLEDKKLPAAHEMEAEPGANELMIKDFGTKSKIDKNTGDKLDVPETPSPSARIEPSIADIPLKDEVAPINVTPPSVPDIPVAKTVVPPAPVAPAPVQELPVQAEKPTTEPVKPQKEVAPTETPAPIAAKEAEIVQEEKKHKQEPVAPSVKSEEPETATSPSSSEPSIRILGKIDLDALNSKTKPARKSKEDKQKHREEVKTGPSPASQPDRKSVV